MFSRLSFSNILVNVVPLIVAIAEENYTQVFSSVSLLVISILFSNQEGKFLGASETPIFLPELKKKQKNRRKRHQGLKKYSRRKKR